MESGNTEIVATDVEGRPVLRGVRLRILSGPDQGAELRLKAGSAVVGTSAAADLTLQDAKASRLHCEISLLATGVRVRDLESTNGTRHRAARVESMVLAPPFELEIGTSRLAVVPEDAPMPEMALDRTALGPFVGASEESRRAIAMLGRLAVHPSPTLLEGPTGAGKSTALEALVSSTGAPWEHLPRLDLRVDGREAIEQRLHGSVGFVHLDGVEHAGGEAIQCLTAWLTGPDRGRWTPLSESREPLRPRVEAGAFPRDLFFALGVVRLSLSGLDERPEDVEPVARALGVRLEVAPELVGDAIVSARAEGLTRGGWTLATAIAARATAHADPASRELVDLPFKEAKARVVDRFGRDYIAALLARHEGNLSRAAEEAGLARNHLASLAKRYGLR